MSSPVPEAAPLPAPLALPTTLFPEGVVVHALAIGDATEDLAASFAGIVLPDRLRTAVVERRVHFLAGRHCAREALRALSPIHADVAIPIGDNREPIWPHGFRGSISHTKRYAAAAVAPTKLVHGLGIDVERWMKPEAPKKLGAHITIEGELAALVEASGLEASRALTVVFSAKESLFKALYGGVGRYFGFQDARIVAIDSVRGTFAGRLESTLARELVAGFPFTGRTAEVEGGVVTAIAWERER